MKKTKLQDEISIKLFMNMDKVLDKPQADKYAQYHSKATVYAWQIDP